VVPFHLAAREMLDWHDANPSLQVIDPYYEALFTRLAG
jgi:hypothetical protein